MAEYAITSLPFFNRVVTVYNKVFVRNESNRVVSTVYKRTRLDNCYFGHERLTNVEGNVVSDGSRLVCKIPKNSNYVKPTDFGGVDGFTLNVGDLLVAGEVTDNVSSPADESAILAKYKSIGSFVITGVIDYSEFEDILPHYKVTG